MSKQNSNPIQEFFTKDVCPSIFVEIIEQVYDEWLYLKVKYAEDEAMMGKHDADIMFNMTKFIDHVREAAGVRTSWQHEPTQKKAA